MAKHPLRTWLPEEASLFFVPAYLGMSHVGRCGDHRKNMQELVGLLSNSTYYQKSQGADHFISAFEFDMNQDQVWDFKPFYAEMIVARFEIGPHARVQSAFPVPYGAVPLPIVRDAIGERFIKRFDQRMHTIFFMGQADVRGAYTTRRMVLNATAEEFPDSMLIVARNPRSAWDDPVLPACAETDAWHWCRQDWDRRTYAGLAHDAKFFLVLHGDTPSTDRMYDALQFEAIPIIISDGFNTTSMAFPDDVRWSDFAIFVSEQDLTTSPAETLRRVTNMTDDELERKFAALSQARAALLWSAPGNCMGTAILHDLGRRFLNMSNLLPAWELEECQAKPTFTEEGHERSGRGARRGRQAPIPPGFPESFLPLFEADDVAMAPT